MGNTPAELKREKKTPVRSAKKQQKGTRVFVGTEIFANIIKEPAEILLSRGFEIHINPYNRRLTRGDYDACLNGVRYVIAGLEPYDEDVFKKFPDLRVLSRIGIGVDSIDLDAARKHRVSVYNTPEAPSRSVAELTIGFAVCLLRGMIPMNADFHGGQWNPFLGKELAQYTAGLLGFGRIGGMVAERLQPFGSKILACDPVWDEEKAARFGVSRAGFEELLETSDILSLHLPLAPDTRHLMDAKRLSLMKPGAYLINTSRGGIVDDAALKDRLLSGKLAGAALDVFEKEPDTRFFAGVPNVILSPHVGSNTVEARYRMEKKAVENLLAYIDAVEKGEPPPPGPMP